QDGPQSLRASPERSPKELAPSSELWAACCASGGPALRPSPAPARELPGLRRRGRAGAGVLRRRHALRPLREGARQRRYPRAAHRPPDPPAPPRAGAPAIPRRGAPGREAGEHDALRRLGAPPRGRTEAR
ncbi:unnamed protein product, partial [Prorocentrum cordatum]